MSARILIVEDEAITAMDIKRMLEVLDFEVVGVASRGDEAIKKAQEFKPDIILMDIILKGDMDGVEASTAIQELLDVPIIYMSAFSDKDTFKRAKLTKPYGFLTKPINYGGLSVSIETAIYKHDLDKKLAESQEKLRRAHDDLELKVQERTVELENAYEEIYDLYNKAPCGYHSLDKNGYFLKINDTELSWLGYSREEIIEKKNITDLLTEESIETFKKSFPDFKERGYGFDLEFDMIRKDGTILPVLVNATAIKDAEGNYLMSRSSIFDISEHKRAEEALKVSEKASKEHINEIEDIYNSAYVGLYVLDQELRYKCINERMAKLNGISPEEHIGKTVSDIVPDIAEQAEKIAQKIFDSGEPVLDIEFNGTTKAMPGVLRTWIEQWVHLKDDEGNVTSINIVAMELSENKQLKKQ